MGDVLHIFGVKPKDEGAYHCVVILTDETIDTADTVVGKPQI